MKWVLNVLGVILLLVGIVWILQGVNILPGSFMSGQLIYLFLGIVVGAIGVVVLIYNNRKRRATIAGDRSRMDH
jgi:predicted tellurium resistance membrane protein TerC